MLKIVAVPFRTLETKPVVFPRQKKRVTVKPSFLRRWQANCVTNPASKVAGKVFYSLYSKAANVNYLDMLKENNETQRWALEEGGHSGCKSATSKT